MIVPYFLYSQVNHPGKPMGPDYDGNQGVTYLAIFPALPVQSKSKFPKADYKDHFKVDHFAEAIDIRQSPLLNGSWDTLSNKTVIWRMGILSQKASSLGLIFNEFYLKSGCKLLVYTPSLKQIYGAFTFRNNRNNGIFAITPVDDDSLILELQLSPNNSDFGTFVLQQISIGYPVSTDTKSTMDRWYRRSAECNVDVNCVLNTYTQKQKHSVCRIIYNNTDRCTGTLLNNTSHNGRTLVLTAGHCLNSESDASTALFYFDYESPYCNGGDGPIKSISGSQLLSRSSNVDFALVELNESLPIDYNVVYSGWDITDDPITNSYTIHHPEGDVKKIAINSDLVLDGNYYLFDPDSHWLVPSYETGTTEFGSSGSAIFDENNRLRGTLSAGDVACSIEIFDYYQKLSHCWSDYSDSTEQLKYWLDPSSTGIQKCNNYYPVDRLMEIGETLSNIDSAENLVDGTLISGWGYLSGHNSKHSSEFAEHYYRNGAKYIYALNVDIHKAYAAQVNSKIIFKIWTGNEFPEYLVFSQELLLFELVPGVRNYIRLDSAIYVDYNFFIGYEIFYSTPLDTFSILIASPRENDGINSAFVKSNDSWQPLTDGATILNTSLTVFPLVFDLAPPDGSQEWKLPTELITLFPNPANDLLHLFFKEKQENYVSITGYDIYGRPVLSKIYHSPEPNFPVEINTLSKGLYILNIEYAGGLIKKKFFKL